MQRDRYDLDRIGPQTWAVVDTWNKRKPIAPNECYASAANRAWRHNSRLASNPKPPKVVSYD